MKIDNDPKPVENTPLLAREVTNDNSREAAGSAPSQIEIQKIKNDHSGCSG